MPDHDARRWIHGRFVAAHPHATLGAQAAYLTLAALPDVVDARIRVAG
jgi:hypothetical protein